MRSPLNLATRPAANERLPAVLFAVAAVLLAGVTVWHGFLVSRLASTAATSLDDEAMRLEQELVDLGERQRALQGGRTDPVAVTRWRLLKGLVDQRTFSWTGLLASLEDTVPAEVRLLGISPEVSHGRFRLALEARTRVAEDAVALVHTLEERPEFEEVFIRNLDGDQEGMRSTYEMTYRPGAPVAMAPGPPPDPEEPGP